MSAVYWTRRGLLALAASAAAAPAFAAAPTRVVVHRDPSCGCCKAWSERLRAEGYAVEIVDEPNMSAAKSALGVPSSLAACHTAEVDGYLIEGHVPPAAIARLLQEKPVALGLAVPGMPMGSVGMEVEDATRDADYDVLLFDATGQKFFGRYRGDRTI